MLKLFKVGKPRSLLGLEAARVRQRSKPRARAIGDRRSAVLAGEFHQLGGVRLGVDLRHVGPRVPQQQLGGFQAVAGTGFGRGRVPELVG